MKNKTEELRKKWLAKLRDPKTRQTTHHLRLVEDNQARFCAIGCALEVAGYDWDLREKKLRDYTKTYDSNEPYIFFKNAYKTVKTAGSLLIVDNDMHYMSLAMIADLIEQSPKLYFEDLKQCE